MTFSLILFGERPLRIQRCADPTLTFFVDNALHAPLYSFEVPKEEIEVNQRV